MARPFNYGSKFFGAVTQTDKRTNAFSRGKRERFVRVSDGTTLRPLLICVYYRGLCFLHIYLHCVLTILAWDFITCDLSGNERNTNIRLYLIHFLLLLIFLEVTQPLNFCSQYFILEFYQMHEWSVSLTEPWAVKSGSTPWLSSVAMTKSAHCRSVSLRAIC
jgi:hypothetical protein